MNKHENFVLIISRPMLNIRFILNFLFPMRLFQQFSLMSLSSILLLYAVSLQFVRDNSSPLLPIIFSSKLCILPMNIHSILCSAIDLYKFLDGDSFLLIYVSRIQYMYVNFFRSWLFLLVKEPLQILGFLET